MSRLRRIARSPFINDCRTGRLDMHIGATLGVLFAITLAALTRDHMWTRTT